MGLWNAAPLLEARAVATAARARETRARYCRRGDWMSHICVVVMVL